MTTVNDEKAYFECDTYIKNAKALFYKLWDIKEKYENILDKLRTLYSDNLDSEISDFILDFWRYIYNYYEDTLCDNIDEVANYLDIVQMNFEAIKFQN